MWAERPEHTDDTTRCDALGTGSRCAPVSSGARERESLHSSAGAQPLAEAPRVVGVDGLRGLMAWAVALYHLGILTQVFGGGTPTASVVAVLGLHAAPAFFVISGFCFFFVYADARLPPAALVRFYWLRFLRIAPLFYLTLGLNVLLEQPAGPPLGWGILLQNLSLSFGAFHPNHALVIGGWSIGIECVFYLVFPLLLPLARSRAGMLAAAAALTALAFVYSAIVVEPAAARFNAYVQLPNHAFAFLLGGLIAQLRRRVRLRIPAELALGLVALCLCVWARSEPRFVDHFEIVLGADRARYAAISVLLVAIFALALPRLAFTRRVLAALGDQSYAVYLLHPLGWLIVQRGLPALPAALGLAVALLVTALLAAAAHHGIERPLRRLRAWTPLFGALDVAGELRERVRARAQRSR